MRLEHVLENYTCEIPYNDMMIKVRRFLLSETDGGVFAPAHTHKHFEFHYIVSGKGKVTIEDTEFDVAQGNIFFTKPYIVHSEISDFDNPMVQYGIECEIKFPDDCKNEAEWFEIRTIKRALTSVYHEAFLDSLGILQKFERIQELTKKKPIGYLMKIKLTILECLLDTVEIVLQKEKIRYPVQKESINEKRATIIKNFIDVNLTNNVTIEDVCGQVFLSTRHVNRIFMEIYGQTVNQYILGAKINLSKKRLINSNEDIETIALSVGFSSYQQMYRAFMKEIHMSPSQFREQNYNEAD